MDYSNLIEEMKSWGVTFDDGLSNSEMAAVEEACGVRFPPDYRAFIQQALPMEATLDGFASSFSNWRRNPLDLLSNSREWLLEGILFHIRQQDWIKSWGKRPNDDDEAFQVARQYFFSAPIMIPVFGHRFVPAEPLLAGNPIFSVRGTDIIIYGKNLETYFRVEFGNLAHSAETATPDSEILYWNDFLDYRNFVKS